MSSNSGYTPDEAQEGRAFWYQRYHEQSQNPVTMSATGQKEGGYGAWDAEQYAKDLKLRAHNDPKLANELKTHRDAAASPDHPVSKMYAQRRQDMQEQRRASCTADRERIDLMLKAESKGYSAWLTKESFGNRTQEPAVKHLVKKAEQDKAAAFSGLYKYDRAHSHPLTDPNRDLKKDPPDMSERRAWLVDREGSHKFGQPRARKFDSQNEKELASLGMMPKRWMDAEQQKENERKAPPHSGKNIPLKLEEKVNQRREIDRMTGTQRGADGKPVGRDWAQELRPKTTSEKSKAITSFRREQMDITKGATQQNSPMVADTRAINGKNSVAVSRSLMPERLAARREAAAKQAPQLERKITPGQQSYREQVAKVQEKATPAPAQKAPQQPISRGVVTNKDRPVALKQPSAQPTPQKSVSKDRAYAERVAQRYGQMHEGKNESIRVAKLSNPDYMQRTLAIRKNTPKPPSQAQRVSSRPVNASPKNPSFLSKVQMRTNDFKKSMGQRWNQAVEKLPFYSQDKQRLKVAATKPNPSVKQSPGHAVKPASRKLKPNPVARSSRQPEQVKSPARPTTRPAPNPMNGAQQRKEMTGESRRVSTTGQQVRATGPKRPAHVGSVQSSIGFGGLLQNRRIARPAPNPTARMLQGVGSTRPVSSLKVPANPMAKTPAVNKTGSSHVRPMANVAQSKQPQQRVAPRPQQQVQTKPSAQRPVAARPAAPRPKPNPMVNAARPVRPSTPSIRSPTRGMSIGR